MAKIARAHQKVFCDGVNAQDNISQFGSLKAAAIQYSKDPATIQALTAWGEGWKSAVVTNNAPPLQDENALFYLITRQLAYLFQQGMAEWHESTEYHTGSQCMSGGVIYSSKVDNNTNNAVSNTNYWVPVLTPNTNGGALGNVPLGTVIPIGNTQLWATPASGTVKDGYALCNGQAFTSLPPGSYATGFTGNLPTLTDERFLRGSTVAGAAGGANEATLTTNNIPRLFDGMLQVTGTVNIAHSHTDLSGTTNRSLGSGTAAGNGNHAHGVTGTTLTASNDTGGGAITSGTADETHDISYFSMSLTTTTTGLHTHTVSGSTDISHTHTLGTTNVALASGLTSTLTLGQTSPTAISTQPKYMNVVYVMRVK